MRILITGATGFIGSEVFCRLVRKVGPAKITLLGRRRPEPAGKGLYADRLREHRLTEQDLEGVRYVVSDFMNPERFRSDLNGLEAGPWTVIHMAALIHAKGERSVQERVNLGVTKDLLDWLNARGGHFVFTSSEVAFGGTRRAVIRSERDFATFPPESMPYDYFRTKREAHVAALEHAKVPVTVLCPGVVHGTLEHYKDSRSHLVALREGRLNLAPPGGNSFVHLDAVATAVVEAALDAEPKAKTTRLLVDRCLTYHEYFTTYTKLARGAAAQKIRPVPNAVGWLGRALFRLASAVGLHLSALEGLAQGSLYLFFRSEFGLCGGPSVEDAILAGIRASKPSREAISQATALRHESPHT